LYAKLTEEAIMSRAVAVENRYRNNFNNPRNQGSNGMKTIADSDARWWQSEGKGTEKFFRERQKISAPGTWSV